MRILMVPSWYPHSVDDLDGSFFREQANALAAAGHQVRVASPAPVYISQWARHWPGAKDHPLRPLSYLQPAGGPHAAQVPVTVAPFRAWPAPLRGAEEREALVWARREGRAYLQAEGQAPDLIHVHTLFPGLAVTGWLKGFFYEETGREVPHVLTEHRPLFHQRAFGGVRGREIRQGLQAAALRTAVSTGFATAMAQTYPLQPNAPWEVSPNLLGPSFEFAPDLGFDPEGPFLHVSNLGYAKNTALLLRAYGRYRQNGGKRGLDIVGPISAHPEFRQLGEELGLGQQLRWLGPFGREELPQAYRGHCAFVLPSQVETFGIVMAEALSQGLPLISTPTWGGEEIIGRWQGSVGAESSILLSGWEEAELAAALQQMEGRLGRVDPAALRHQALSRWGSQAFVDYWEEAYRQALAASTGAQTTGAQTADSQLSGTQTQGNPPGRGVAGGEEKRRPKVIFHLPFAYDPNGNSAPKIRPKLMIDAFAAAGCDVTEVTGPRAQRRAAMAQVRRRLAQGEHFDLVYSEAATIPTTIVEPGHWPPVPFLDFRFLRSLARAGLPIGLFYRDVYWRLPDYTQRVGRLAAAVLKTLYHWDLWNYRRFLKVLYLPSLRMGKCLPVFPLAKMKTLPPGCKAVQSEVACDTWQPGQPLHLLYVGALGRYYNLDELLVAMDLLAARKIPVHLHICTNKSQWEEYQRESGRPLPPGTQVHHESGAGLEALYRQSHISLLFMQPSEFRDNTYPVKLFEALSFGCPMIAARPSLASEFVAEEGVGWAIEYRAEDFAQLLERIYSGHHEGQAPLQPNLTQASRRCREVAGRNQWADRARQVLSDLGLHSAAAKE